MYQDGRIRYCSIHTTMVHPCQICATPGTVPSQDPTAPIAGVNWQAEGQIVYNTPAPPPVPPGPTDERIVELDDYLTRPSENPMPRSPWL